MVTNSSNRGFTVPTVGGDNGIWGGEQNTGIFAPVDAIFGGTTVIASTTFGATAVLTSSMAQTGRILCSPLTANIALTFASSNFTIGSYCVVNGSTQFTVTCQTTVAGSTTVTVWQSNQRMVWCDGSAVTAMDQPGALASFEFMFQSGQAGTAISTGTVAYLRAPFGFLITDWAIASSASATADVLIQKSSFSGFPGSLATISGSCDPNLIVGTRNSDSTLTGWTKVVNQGDMIVASISSCSSPVLLVTINGVRTTPS